MSEIAPLPNDWSESELAAHRRILERSLRPDCRGLAPHHVLDILRKKLPPDDGWLGLMKVKQERKGYALSGVYLGQPPDSPPHYFGVSCRSARDEKLLRDAIDWSLNVEGPSVIETFIDVEPYSLTVFG